MVIMNELPKVSVLDALPFLEVGISIYRYYVSKKEKKMMRELTKIISTSEKEAYDICIIL